jgi:hypothetical protein
MSIKPILIAALVFGGVCTAAGQSPDRLMGRALKAMGEKPVKALRSATRQGTVTRADNGATGTFLMQTTRPGLYRVKMDVGGFEREYGYNGKSAWMRDSANGLATLTGRQSLDLQAEANFRNNLWVNYKKERMKAVSCGRTDVSGKAANCVSLNTTKGVTIKVHFDAATGLPVREEFPAGEMARVLDYSDYRSVNGVQEPFGIDMRTGEIVHEIRLTDVSHNSAVAKGEFDFPELSNEPLPEIPALLKALQANEDRVEDMLENYSYTQKVTRRELGKDGVLRETGSETTQLSFYKGYRITRLVEKNGRPLNERDQADEDREVAKRVEEIEKRIRREERRAVEQSAAGPPSGEGRRISVAEVLRASLLLNPRRERFKGRDVIVFDFEPNPNFDYKNAKSFLRFFGKCAGVMWIDEKDRQVARIDAILYDSYKVGGGLLANLKKGATFTLEQERVNDEIWLPSTADINLSVKVLLVKGINVNSVVRSFNYRKFSTEVEDAKVTDTVN